MDCCKYCTFCEITRQNTGRRPLWINSTVIQNRTNYLEKKNLVSKYFFIVSAHQHALKDVGTLCTTYACCIHKAEHPTRITAASGIFFWCPFLLEQPIEAQKYFFAQIWTTCQTSATRLIVEATAASDAPARKLGSTKDNPVTAWQLPRLHITTQPKDDDKIENSKMTSSTCVWRYNEQYE